MKRRPPRGLSSGFNPIGLSSACHDTRLYREFIDSWPFFDSQNVEAGIKVSHEYKTFDSICLSFLLPSSHLIFSSTTNLSRPDFF